MKMYQFLFAAALLFTGTFCAAGDGDKAPEGSDKNSESSQSSRVDTGGSKTQNDDC